MLCLENTAGTGAHNNSNSVWRHIALHDPRFLQRLLGGPQPQLITPA
jgi:hypothetical protein